MFSYKTMSNKKFNGILKSACAASKKAGELWHEAGLFAVYQSIAHGQTTPALDLVRAMPTSQRREAMVKWLEELSWCKFIRGKEGEITGVKCHKSKAIQIELLDTHMAKIEGIRYYEYHKEEKAEKKAWAFYAKLADLIKLAEKHLEKGDGEVDPVELGEAKALAIKLALKRAGNVEQAQ